MRKMLILGTAALSVVFGVGAASAANTNVPSWSPYAVMPQQDADSTYANPGHANNPGYPPQPMASAGYSAGPAYYNRPNMAPGFIEEGRAAYVDAPPYRYYGGPPRPLFAPTYDWGTVGLSPGNTGDYSNFF